MLYRDLTLVLNLIFKFFFSECISGLFLSQREDQKSMFLPYVSVSSTLINLLLNYLKVQSHRGLTLLEFVNISRFHGASKNSLINLHKCHLFFEITIYFED